MAQEKAKSNNKVPGRFRVTQTAYRCRCGHEWLARGMLNKKKVRPAACPACRSAHWDRPYKNRRAGARPVIA